MRRYGILLLISLLTACADTVPESSPATTDEIFGIDSRIPVRPLEQWSDDRFLSERHEAKASQFSRVCDLPKSDAYTLATKVFFSKDESLTAWSKFDIAMPYVKQGVIEVAAFYPYLLLQAAEEKSRDPETYIVRQDVLNEILTELDFDSALFLARSALVRANAGSKANFALGLEKYANLLQLSFGHPIIDELAYWNYRAAAEGNELAMHWLAYHYRTLLYTGRDYAESYKWELLEEDYVKAQSQIGANVYPYSPLGWDGFDDLGEIFQEGERRAKHWRYEHSHIFTKKQPDMFGCIRDLLNENRS